MTVVKLLRQIVADIRERWARRLNSTAPRQGIVNTGRLKFATAVLCPKRRLPDPLHFAVSAETEEGVVIAELSNALNTSSNSFGSPLAAIR
jgi:hypothetical protein